MKWIWSVINRNRRNKPPDERSTEKKVRVAHPTLMTKSRITRPSAAIKPHIIAVLLGQDLRPANVPDNETAPVHRLRHGRIASRTDRRRPSSRPASRVRRSFLAKGNTRNRRSGTTRAHRANPESKSNRAHR